MLAIQSSSKSQKCTPNLLPARVNHDGPINDAQQYWKPETDENGKSHVYFRGRHLHGTSLPLPANYTGAVLVVTDKVLPAGRGTEENRDEEDDDEDDADMVEVNLAEKVGEFEEVIVWGHGEAIDQKEDVYARGIQEWIGFAEAMHGDENDEGEGQEKKKD